MVAAQCGHGIGGQPGDVAVGRGSGLPGGEVLRRGGAKAKHVSGLQVHGHVQVGVVQVHRAAHDEPGAAVQAALGQQRGAYIRTLQPPLRRQCVQRGRVQLTPYTVAGQRRLKGGEGVRGRVHGGRDQATGSAIVAAVVRRGGRVVTGFDVGQPVGRPWPVRWWGCLP
jgi:hypothetical protein